MRLAIPAQLVILAVLALHTGQVSSALTCFDDKDKCGEGECCVKIPGTELGICKKLREEGKTCELNSLRHAFAKHVYLLMCPCIESMTCIAKDGILGNVVGTCQEEGENPKA
ncbi:hypothetical protein DFH09DRAFT_1086367 [Mycena vulgaris]|nr:hypothetical protein DFH09DRAFT_1086367 [Mycena vulgaris]